MKMRHLLTIILFCAISTLAFGQVDSPARKMPGADTAFKIVDLRSASLGNKIISFKPGGKAIIYLSASSILNAIKESTAGTIVVGDEIIKENNSLSKKIVSLSKKKDTAEMDDVYRFRYIVATELINGHAKVFYKKEKSFVPTISHRLEGYGKFNADRFFYLPNRMPFFSVMSFAKASDHEKSDAEKKEELIKRAEKLKQITEE